MHGLGDVFGKLFAQRGIGRVMPPAGTRSFIKDVVIDDSKQLPPAPTENELRESAPGKRTDQQLTDKDGILRIFSTKGEALELRTIA